MSDVTLEQVLDLARQLDHETRLVLIKQLQAENQTAQSLFGAFATQQAALDQVEIDVLLSTASTAWESELTELDDNLTK